MFGRPTWCFSTVFMKALTAEIPLGSICVGLPGCKHLQFYIGRPFASCWPHPEVRSFSCIAARSVRSVVGQWTEVGGRLASLRAQADRTALQGGGQMGMADFQNPGVSCRAAQAREQELLSDRSARLSFNLVRHGAVITSSPKEV